MSWRGYPSPHSLNRHLHFHSPSSPNIINTTTIATNNQWLLHGVPQPLLATTRPPLARHCGSLRQRSVPPRSGLLPLHAANRPHRYPYPRVRMVPVLNRSPPLPFPRPGFRHRHLNPGSSSSTSLLRPRHQCYYHVRSLLSSPRAIFAVGDPNLNQFRTIRREFHSVSLETFRQTMAALLVLRTELFDYPTRAR